MTIIHREDALIAIISAEKHSKQWLVLIRLAKWGAAIGLLLFSLVGVWLYIENISSTWAAVCLIVTIGCAVSLLLTMFVEALFEITTKSLYAQRVDFATQQTVLISILNLIADQIAIEFRNLRYLPRHNADTSLEIARSLTKELRKLGFEMIDEEWQLNTWFKNLQESEGFARLGGIEGYLTTTGFNHEAVEELWSLLQEKFDVVRHIRQHSPVNTETAVQLIIAMRQCDKALDMIRQFHEDQSVMSLEEIRAARQAGE